MEHSITLDDLLSLLLNYSPPFGPESDSMAIDQEINNILQSVSPEWLSPLISVMYRYLNCEIDSDTWNNISPLFREIFLKCSLQAYHEFMAHLPELLQHRELWTILLPVIGWLKSIESLPLLNDLFDRFPSDLFLLSEITDTIEDIGSNLGINLLSKLRIAVPLEHSYLLLRIDDVERNLSFHFRNRD